MSYITNHAVDANGKYRLHVIRHEAFETYQRVLADRPHGVGSLADYLDMAWERAQHEKARYDASIIDAKERAKDEIAYLRRDLKNARDALTYCSNSPISLDYQNKENARNKAREAYEAALVHKSQKEAA